jgi:hypothetical protein
VQGVKHQGRASSGLTKGVGSIFYVLLESLWRETKIGDVLRTSISWEDIVDEAERLLAISKASRNAAKDGHDDGEQERDQEVERDETDPYNEVIFGRRRPNSVVVAVDQQVPFCFEIQAYK